MPSTFRSSRSGRHLDGPNRTRNGQIDHDVFEGLPVRRWSKQPYTYSQTPKAVDDSDVGAQGPGGPVLPELPMPRDSDLLSAVSKSLLRAARAGCIYIRQNTTAADKEENDPNKPDDQAAGSVQMADRSFTSRKWLTLPKHMEPPEVEFLAKRRPGLPSLYGGASAVDGSSGSLPMRRTKFKKVDPVTGNISIYEAWVPEGHRIEGEVTGDVQSIAEQSSVPVKPETPAPGTVVEGVGIVNSEGVVVAEPGSAAVMEPSKRRPPPPKRKSKGIGKGRKKKVMFAPGEGADAATVHNVAPGTEGGAAGSQEQQDGSRMSIDHSGQDDDDDDGEDGDESDEGDESMMDAKTPETPGAQSGAVSTPQPAAGTPTESKDIDMRDAAPEAQPSVSEPPAAAGQEPLSHPSAAPSESLQIDADVSASASVTPGLPTEKGEEASAQEPVPARTENTGEIVPKEESEAPEQPSLFATASATAPTADENTAQEASQPPASEVKAEAQFEKPVDEASEPAKEPEPVQSGEASAQTTKTRPVVEVQVQRPAEAETPENAPAPEGTEKKEAGPSETEVGASEAKEDVEMGDALEAQPQAESTAAQSPIKSASPTAPASEPQPSAPSTEEASLAPETERKAPAPSAEHSHEAAPSPKPTEAESAPEKDQAEAPPTESA